MKSTRPRMIAKQIVEMMTIFADWRTSVLPGQETFFISATHSLKYLPIFLNIRNLLLPPRHQRVRYDSNVQHPVLETSALTVGATNPLVPRTTPILLDFGFPVESVLSLKRTILHQLKLACRVAAVLLSCIVLLLALCALQCDFFYRCILLSVCHILLLKQAPERI